MPQRVLYAEPLRRRTRAELGGRTVVQSDDAVLLFEPGRYPDIDDAGHAAWSYRAPFDDMAAIGDLVSFELDRVEVTLDGERLEPEPGQTGTDRTREEKTP